MRFQTLREARWILLVLFVLIAISVRINSWLNIIWTGLILGTLYFFRDPNRNTPSDSRVIVAAADGRIVCIDETFESEVLKTVATRVAIFLSVFDVHVNRAPIDGEITWLLSHWTVWTRFSPHGEAAIAKAGRATKSVAVIVTTLHNQDRLADASTRPKGNAWANLFLKKEGILCST